MANTVFPERCQDTLVTAPKHLIGRSGGEACLVHIYPSGPNIGHRYSLGVHGTGLGRGDDNEVRIKDSSVSRKHARIISTTEGFFISDLNSTNGTFVNDKPTNDATPLTDGDMVRVGNCIYKFLTGGNVELDYHEEIYRLTIIDALTEIHNRRYLVDFLDRELARSIRHERPLSTIMFDIDHFKAVNDEYGHLCGDFVLRELSSRLRGQIRREDLLARCGGEEFFVVLVETPIDAARETAERIRETIGSTPFSFEEEVLPLTISVGVSTTCGENGLTVEDLLRRTDEKLYLAKTNGRNRVES